MGFALTNGMTSTKAFIALMMLVGSLGCQEEHTACENLCFTTPRNVLMVTNENDIVLCTG